MYLKELVILAKNNDNEAKEKLIKHYEPMFIKHVRNHHGNIDEKEIKTVFLSLVEHYLKNDYSMILQEFLYAKSINFGNNREIIVGSKVDITDKEKSNYVVNHYSKTFFEKIKNYNDVLTKEELEVFSYQFIKKLLDYKYKCDNDIRAIMVSYIATEVKSYKKEIDSLYKRYILCVGLNDKIVDYFYNKYIYLLDEIKINPKQKIKYNYLESKFREIVKDSLGNISSMTNSVSSLIKKNMDKEYKNYKVNENIEENKSILFEKYSYLKETIYSKFEDKIAYGNDVLKKEIDEKYNEYFSIYLNGNSTSNIPKYLNTRLTDYFNRLKNKILPNNFIYKDDEYYSYIDYVEKYLEKLNTNFPYEYAKNILINKYDEIYKKYYINNKKSDIISIIQNNFYKLVNNLNINYSDENICLMKELFKNAVKENNLLETDILDKVIDELTNYYLNFKTSNKKPYEIFMIEQIKNFDYEKYIEIQNIKEKTIIKVLR